MKTKIEPKEMARALAQACDEEQGEFFNEFGAYLKACCNGKQDTQLCYIIRYLDYNGVAILKEMAGFADMAADDQRQKAEWNEQTRCKKIFDTNEQKIQELQKRIEELEQ